MLKKGDIVLIPFPFTDLSGAKVRPAVVLAAPRKAEDILVAFITSQSKSGYPYRVVITPSEDNGIKVPSWVLCAKLATLDRGIIVGSIGHCEAKTLSLIDAELMKLLAL